MTTRTKTKFCKFCGNRFVYTRDDAEFCGPRCTAAFTRSEGYHRERFHEEKTETNTKACEHCGTEFYYNTYADRGGQRVPQYCSNRCRTAAFRKRHKDSAFNGGANHWQEGRSDKTQRKGTATGGSERERQNYEDTRREQDARSRARAEETYKDTSQSGRKHTSQSNTKHTSQSADKDTSHIDARWRSKDAYVILGVTYVSSKADIKKAYYRLAKIWHPDVCKDAHAEEIMKAINWAYARLG